MNDKELIENYLTDLVSLLIEKADAVKLSKSESESDYDAGQLMAYHEVLSLMKQQAEIYDIDEGSIGLDSINEFN